MLSEETAIGRYPVEAVVMMAIIATSAERERESIRDLYDLPAYFRKSAGSGKSTVEDIVSLDAVEAAQALRINYILVTMQSGGTPRLISRFKSGTTTCSKTGCPEIVP
ncbi:MAG TPA: hypothetical protein DDY17_10430 [Syntrophaceae bacterium]|jgi:pyruvate kinase|nr:hypothetical protein [Syntrophaceae bacterium]